MEGTPHPTPGIVPEPLDPDPVRDEGEADGLGELDLSIPEDLWSAVEVDGPLAPLEPAPGAEAAPDERASDLDPDPDQEPDAPATTQDADADPDSDPDPEPDAPAAATSDADADPDPDPELRPGARRTRRRHPGRGRRP